MTIEEQTQDMAQSEQAKLIRQARKTLGLTSEQLADELGVTVVTLNSWLRPPTTDAGLPAKAHRTMPETARKLLARILADVARKKKS